MLNLHHRKQPFASAILILNAVAQMQVVIPENVKQGLKVVMDNSKVTVSEITKIVNISTANT